MRDFIYTANPARVVFGSGTINKLADKVRRLGLKNPLILSTPNQVDHAARVQELLSSAGLTTAGQFNNATMHTPLEVTEQALNQVNASGADGIIAIGGGSTIGLGKVCQNSFLLDCEY